MLRKILWGAGSHEKLTYETLVARLQSRFGAAGQRERFSAELRALRRKNGESLAELHSHVRRLMSLAYPESADSDLGEIIARDHFIAALNDRELELKVRDRDPPDLDSAFKVAVRAETHLRAYENEREQHRDQRNRRDRADDVRARQIQRPDDKQNFGADGVAPSVVEHLLKQVESSQKERDELSRELGRVKLLLEQGKERAVTLQKIPVAPADALPSVAQPQRSCFNCKQPGHISRYCPEKQQRTYSAPKTEEAAKGVCGTSSNTAESPTYLTLKIGGRSVSCLLDTGSEVTLIPSKVAGNAPIKPATQRLFAANGTTINIIGETKLTALIDAETLEISGLVSDHVTEVILGIDFLRRNKAVWDFDHDVVKINGCQHILHSRASKGWCRRIVTSECIQVPPLSEAVVPAIVAFNGKIPPPDLECWATEPGQPLPGIHVASALLPPRVTDVPIRILNSSNHAVDIDKGTVLSSLITVEPCDARPVETQNSRIDERQNAIRAMLDNISPEISPVEREKFHALLLEFSSIFSFNEFELGRTTLIKHGIDTGNAKPVHQRLRKQPPAYQSIISEHVATMLKQDVIEPAQSPWAANIVLVRKKTGEFRCCADFRGLNDVTRKDAYALPRTDMCLDSMAGATWFSTLDLRSSYHQIEVEPADRDKTAFVCREGMFRYKTTPFGLCNAGATCQRLMDLVTSGLAYEICLAYVDDVIIFSSTVLQHFERVRLVFERFKAAGLKLKPSKCFFFQRSVSFLGHVVSGDGIGADPEKIRAVAEWPTPTCVRDVRAFVGLASYYRRYVKGFAGTAASLTALFSPNKQFVWTQKEQDAFDSLKSALTKPPILTMPRPDGLITLDTDASNFSIGAVLSQNQDGEERVIAYASRKLSRTEMNYCVSRRELLAIIYFVKYFRQYLLGIRFRIRTDHASLLWLRRIAEPIGQQARWLEILEEFDYFVEHRPGIRHGNADSMSRVPCDKARCCNRGKNELTPAVEDVETAVITEEKPVCKISTVKGDTLGSVSLNECSVHPKTSAVATVARCNCELVSLVLRDVVDRVSDVAELRKAERAGIRNTEYFFPSVSRVEGQVDSGQLRASYEVTESNSSAIGGVRSDGTFSVGEGNGIVCPLTVKFDSAVTGPCNSAVGCSDVRSDGTFSVGEGNGIVCPPTVKCDSAVAGPDCSVAGCRDVRSDDTFSVGEGNGVVCPHTVKSDGIVFDVAGVVLDNLPTECGKSCSDPSYTASVTHDMPCSERLDENSLIEPRTEESIGRRAVAADSWSVRVLNTVNTALDASETANVNARVNSPTDLPETAVDALRLMETDPNNIIRDQKADPDIGKVVEMIRSDRPRPEWDAVASWSETSKVLWRQWGRLSVREGVLVRRYESADGLSVSYQIIMPRCQRAEFIRSIHGGIGGGHLGRKRTEVQVMRRAYWPGWVSDVRRVLRACHECARYQRGKPRRQTLLAPIGSGEPWEIMSIDITGPHPVSRQGYQYILTVQDHFTKWVEAFPLRKHTAVVVARVLVENVFLRFGAPLRLLSDQGPEFESDLLKELCRLLRIEKIRTTPYHPSTNGMLERFHRTLNAMIGKVVNDDQRDWPDHLPAALAAYRATVHDATGVTPYRMMFGRELRLPVDVTYGLRPDSEQSATSNEEYVDRLNETLRRCFDVARANLGRAASLRKQNYDAKVRVADYNVGDKVWYFCPRRYKNRSPKWQKNFTGPYEIMRIIDSHTIVIRKNARAKCIVVHRDKLKPVISLSEPDGAAQPRRINEDGNDSIEQNFEAESDCDSRVQGASDRPIRRRRPPVRLNEYHVSCVCVKSAFQDMAAKGPGWCEACRHDHGDAHRLRTHQTSAKHATAADAFRRGFEAGWLAALSRGDEGVHERSTEGSTAPIISRFTPLEDHLEDDAGLEAIIRSAVAPTEACETEVDDFAIVDESSSITAAFCRVVVKDANVAASVGGIEREAEPSTATQPTIEPPGVVAHLDDVDAADMSLAQSAEAPADVSAGSSAPEVVHPTLDALLECDWDGGDIWGDNPHHLSPSDWVGGRDRSPHESSEAADDVLDAASYVKPPFEGWTVPPFPAPRNREEKKWLRGYFKGRLPSQRKAARKSDRHQ
jgi:transposase InsO family protein